MADVRIDDLQPNDAELLADDESFMGELSEDELGQVAGGITPGAVAAAVASGAACAGMAGGAASLVGGAIWGALDN
jgi:hypothetical protein